MSCAPCTEVRARAEPHDDSDSRPNERGNTLLCGVCRQRRSGGLHASESVGARRKRLLFRGHAGASLSVYRHIVSLPRRKRQKLVVLWAVKGRFLKSASVAQESSCGGVSNG